MATKFKLSSIVELRAQLSRSSVPSNATFFTCQIPDLQVQQLEWDHPEFLVEFTWLRWRLPSRMELRRNLFVHSLSLKIIRQTCCLDLITLKDISVASTWLIPDYILAKVLSRCLSQAKDKSRRTRWKKRKIYSYRSKNQQVDQIQLACLSPKDSLNNKCVKILRNYSRLVDLREIRLSKRFLHAKETKNKQLIY